MTIDVRYKILAFYVSFLVIILLGCLPYMMAQNISGIGALLLLVGSYLFKEKFGDDSLEVHHMTFIIRTIWIWSAFLMIGLIGAGYIVATQGDMSTIDQLIININEGMIPTEADMNSTIQSYLATNETLIIKTALMWLAPAQFYAVWRIAKGAARARHGYRLANVRHWF